MSAAVAVDAAVAAAAAVARPAGILLPESILYSTWFGVFAAFVAINTVIYVLLSVAKLIPVIRFGKRSHGAEVRAETRSIYPTPEAHHGHADTVAIRIDEIVQDHPSRDAS